MDPITWVQINSVCGKRIRFYLSISEIDAGGVISGKLMEHI